MDEPAATQNSHNLNDFQKSFVNSLYHIIFRIRLDYIILDSEQLEEFIDILEAIYEKHDSLKGEKKLKKPTNDSLYAKITQGYENLKHNQVHLKILFHKYHPICGIRFDDFTFNSIKNYSTRNEKFIFKELCEAFEREVIPQILRLRSIKINKIQDLYTYGIYNEVRSIVDDSYMRVELTYIPYKGTNDQMFYSLGIPKIKLILTRGFLNVDLYNETLPTNEATSYFIKDGLKKKHTSADKSLVTQDGHADYLFGQLKYFEILVTLEAPGKYCKFKYFARRQTDTFEELDYFREVPVIQQSTTKLLEYIKNLFKMSLFEIEVFKYMYCRRQSVLLLSRYKDKICVQIGSFTSETVNEKRLLAIGFKYLKQTSDYKDIILNLLPFTRHQINDLFRVTADPVVELTSLNPQNSRDRESFVQINLKVFSLILEQQAIAKTYGRYALFNALKTRESILESELTYFINDSLERIENEELSITEAVQAHALTMLLSNQLVSSLKLVSKAFNPKSDSVTDQFFLTPHFVVIAQYFVAQFLTENVFKTNYNRISQDEAKRLVDLLAVLTSDSRYNSIIDYIISFSKIGIITDWSTKTVLNMIKRAKLWPKVIEYYGSERASTLHLTRFVDFINFQYFWTKVILDNKTEPKSKKNSKQSRYETLQKSQLKPSLKPQQKAGSTFRKFRWEHEFMQDIDDSEY